MVNTNIPTKAISNSWAIALLRLMPTYSAKPTSAHPNASNTFASKNTPPTALNINPGSDHDVFDVESVAQRHLHKHSEHGQKQKARDPESHRTPLREQFPAATLKR